jgi:hypothetical protein
MGRRNSLRKRIATAQSLAASFQTDPIKVDGVDRIWFFVVTDSVSDNTGEFKIGFRPLDEATGEYGPWQYLPLENSALLNNADDDFLFPISDLVPGQIRLEFAADGVTPNGTAEIWITGTSQGA